MTLLEHALVMARIAEIQMLFKTHTNDGYKSNIHHLRLLGTLVKKLEIRKEKETEKNQSFINESERYQRQLSIMNEAIEKCLKKLKEEK